METPPAKREGLLSRLTLDTRPLAWPAFRRMLAGQGTSYIGTMVTEVAVPVQIYAISRSSLYVGLTGLAGLLPIVVFGLYGGVIADAYDRRRVCLVSSFVTWAVTLLLLAQAVLGMHSVGLVLALVVVQSGGFAVASSTRAAIIPALVAPEQVPAANTLSYTASNAGQVVGPLLAGVLVGLPHGFAWAYGADAVLFAGALYATFRLPRVPLPAASAKAGLRALAEGLRFIGASPVVLISFAVDIAAMTLALPRALFPEAAATRFHGGVGLLYSSIAIGSIIAGLCSGWIGKVSRQGVALALAVCCWAAAIAVAGLVSNIWLASLLLALAGGADLVSVVYRQTILQTYAPDELRGRLQGVFTVVVAGGPRLGDLRSGAMAATAGLTVAWSGAALACIPLTLLLAVAVRPFWQYRAGENPGSASGADSGDLTDITDRLPPAGNAVAGPRGSGSRRRRGQARSWTIWLTVLAGCGVAVLGVHLATASRSLDATSTANKRRRGPGGRVHQRFQLVDAADRHLRQHRHLLLLGRAGRGELAHRRADRHRSRLLGRPGGLLRVVRGLPGRPGVLQRAGAAGRRNECLRHLERRRGLRPDADGRDPGLGQDGRRVGAQRPA